MVGGAGLELIVNRDKHIHVSAQGESLMTEMCKIRRIFSQVSGTSLSPAADFCRLSSIKSAAKTNFSRAVSSATG